MARLASPFLARRIHIRRAGLFWWAVSVLAPYLLFASYKANGDMKVLLMGKVRDGD
jgi:hypothetical protein